MDASERISLYTSAMERLSPYLGRRSDGTFSLEIRDGEQIGIDQIVFADLARSLEETNKRISSGEISLEGVEMNTISTC